MYKRLEYKCPTPCAGYGKPGKTAHKLVESLANGAPGHPQAMFSYRIHIVIHVDVYIMYMDVCIDGYVYRIHIHKLIHVYICTCIYMYICMCVYISIFSYVHIYICRTYRNKYTHIYIYIHTCMYVYIYMYVSLQTMCFLSGYSEQGWVVFLLLPPLYVCIYIGV